MPQPYGMVINMKITFINFKPNDDLLNMLSKMPDISVEILSDGITASIAVPDVAVFALPITYELTAECKKLLVLQHEELLQGKTYSDFAHDIVSESAAPAEFVIRILRLIAPVNRVFEKNGLKIDFNDAKVFIGQEPVRLTLSEYRLLCVLAEKSGETVTYDELLCSLWDSPIGSEMLSLRVFVNAMRRKFRAAGAKSEHIVNCMGKGYRLQ